MYKHASARNRWQNSQAVLPIQICTANVNAEADEESCEGKASLHIAPIGMRFRGIFREISRREEFLLHRIYRSCWGDRAFVRGSGSWRDCSGRVPYLSPFSRVFLLNSLISLALCLFVSLAVSVSVAVFLSVSLPLFPSRINSVFPCLIHSRHSVYEHAYICTHARLSVWVFVWVCVFVISVGNVFFSICKIVSLYFLFRHIYCTFFLLIKLMPFQSAWLVLLNKAYFQNGKNLYIN